MSVLPLQKLTKEKSISIGKPIANTQCYILNKNQKLLPFEVPGELYIGGDGVSNGYLKREELNKEKFIENPFKDKDKIYNTNDLAYYNENGDIVHLGRTDFQVKIRGFRVELGEIENEIEKDNNIIQSIVVKRKLNNNRDALIAYYTSVSNDNGNINERISKELPEASTHTINNFKKQKMRIRLNQNQMNYLYDNFIKGNTCLMLKLRIDKKENVYLIEVNDDIADQIRDWANLQLQRKGFDRHYKLTKEGEILDMLIDAF